MAGFFDALTNMTPEQNQGLLNAAASLLQWGGPSRTPTSTGQAFGAGLQAFQQGMQDSQDRSYQQQLRSLQLEEANMTAEERKRKRQLEQQIQSAALASVRDPSQMALAGGGGPTMANAEAMQGMQPGFDEQGFINRVRAVDPLRAMDFERQFAKAAPEFDTKINTLTGADGRPVAVLVNKAGQVKTLDGLTPREKAEFLNLGGREVAVNPYAVQPGQQFQRTASADAMLTDRRLREQNLIAREANQIASGQKIASASTALRKEFDDLPEVKNYKQALPAYSAIVDATKRNTPQADINLVYGIAKLYDPTSVVREGEYNTVANSPNIPDRIKGYAQYLAGGGKLTPAVKQQILQEATGRINSYEGEYVATRNNYSDIAQRSGADPSLLFPSSFKPATEKAQANTGKKISLADIAETARKSGRTTAEVTAAARAKGYTIGD